MFEMTSTANLILSILPLCLAIVIIAYFTTLLHWRRRPSEGLRKQEQLEALLSIATVGSTFSSAVFYSVFSDYVNAVVFYLDENSILRPDNILLINPEAGIYGEVIENGNRVLIERSLFIDISSYSNRLPSAHRYSFEPYRKNPLTAFYVRERDFSAFKTWWEKPNSSTFTKSM